MTEITEYLKFAVQLIGKYSLNCPSQYIIGENFVKDIERMVVEAFCFGAFHYSLIGKSEWSDMQMISEIDFFFID